MSLCKCGRKNTGIFCAFAVCFMFFCLLMSCVPLVSDDVEFAALEFSGVSEWINYVLYYGNGRFLGNLGAVFLSKLPVLGIFVKAFFLAGMIFLIPAVLDIRDLTGYLLSFLLFVTIRQALFGQLYTWTSGLMNYVPPVFTTLLIVLLIKRYDRTDLRWKKVVLTGAIILLGVAGQLFVEHCSLMNVLMAGCFVAVRWKTKRTLSPAVCWLIAAVAGAAIMFAIPLVFFAEGNRSEGYRSVNLAGIAGVSLLARSVLNLFAKMGAAFPPVGSVAAAGAAAATAWLTRQRRSSLWNTVLYTCCTCVIAYFFVNEFVLRNMWFVWQQDTRKFITACFAFLPFLLWAVALFPLEDKRIRGRIYFLLAMALCSLIPFLVVTPSPARTLFFAFACTVTAVLQFYGYVRDSMSENLSRCIRRTALTAAVTTGMLLLLIFANISWISNLRETHIRQEMEAGKTEITIFEDPYTYVHWSGVGCYGRSFYYEEPDDIRFTSTDFEGWYQTVWLPKNGK